jgi:hypothetical protein
MVAIVGHPETLTDPFDNALGGLRLRSLKPLHGGASCRRQDFQPIAPPILPKNPVLASGVPSFRVTPVHCTMIVRLEINESNRFIT